MMAVRKTLVFAKEEGLERVSLATDCLSVVQRINARGMDRSICGPVVQTSSVQSLLSLFALSFMLGASKIKQFVQILLGD
jgi:hypothetical protein